MCYCLQSVTFGGENYDTFFVGTDAAIYDVQTGKILQFGAGPDDGYMYKILCSGVKGQPERKISLKYATCMNDPAALDAQKKRQGLKAQLMQIDSALQELLRNGQPY